MASVAGPAAAALASLSQSQLDFIRNLPKAELHAHLNGSIPIATLQELARERAATKASEDNASIQSGLELLKNGVTLDAIDDFFGLFPAIYVLTSNPAALKRVTIAVLDMFLREHVEGDAIIPPECTYLELRSTPRQTSEMTRKEYLEAVLSEIERFSADQAALIVSVDRRMSVEDATECVELAIALKKDGRRVVGVDLCGSPRAGNMKDFLPLFSRVHEAGLGLTLHIAEVDYREIAPDTDVLLSATPTRLGHATFLDLKEQQHVTERFIPIELCLSSNILCKTVASLEAHHIKSYLKVGHPIAICTDDALPFRTTLTAEYALLMAKAPLGLGLSEAEVGMIANMSLDSRFGVHP